LDISRYFDNAATTPVDPRVVEEIRRAQIEGFGNAHSIHSAGRDAHRCAEAARAEVAALLGADDPSQIVFTSGATEANNWVISQFESIAISPFEHSSVREPALHRGAVVIGNDGYRLDPIGDRVGLLAVMGVNNETGAILEPPPKGSAFLHRDLTQSVGKAPPTLEAVDSATCSAHKFGGPQGVGALYLRDPSSIAPMLRGGGQEQGLRAGTLNVAGIVGMGLAARLAREEWEARREHAVALREAVLDEIEGVGDWVSASLAASSASPFILSLSFAGLEGETLVIELDARGFAISSGAACSSGSVEPSHVLMALGYDEKLARGTVRLSFGPRNTVEAAAALGRALAETVERLRGGR
jgi:cysteine desulfurase